MPARPSVPAVVKMHRTSPAASTRVLAVSLNWTTLYPLPTTPRYSPVPPRTRPCGRGRGGVGRHEHLALDRLVEAGRSDKLPKPVGGGEPDAEPVPGHLADVDHLLHVVGHVNLAWTPRAEAREERPRVGGGRARKQLAVAGLPTNSLSRGFAASCPLLPDGGSQGSAMIPAGGDG